MEFVFLVGLTVIVLICCSVLPRPRENADVFNFEVIIKQCFAMEYRGKVDTLWKRVATSKLH